MTSTSAPGKLNLMKAAEANPDSLITALMRCAALGHQPGTEEFYLTPRKVKGRLEILGITGYQGYIELMYRAGAVSSVIVETVRRNDEISVEAHGELAVKGKTKPVSVYAVLVDSLVFEEA